MIQKVSKERNIDFVANALTGNVPAIVEEAPKIDKKSLSPIEKVKHLDSKDMTTRGSKVMSAASGNITDMGGPRKQMGSQTNNSIWNPNTIDDLKEIPDSKERVIAEKAEDERLKKGMKKERLDEMVKALEITDQRKTSTVAGMATYQGSNYNTPKNNMSIFDKNDFERVPVQTSGEKVAEEARKPKEKDKSWQKKSKATIKGSIDKFFE